jgi:hypothetical protein
MELTKPQMIKERNEEVRIPQMKEFSFKPTKLINKRKIKRGGKRKSCGNFFFFDK